MLDFVSMIFGIYVKYAKNWLYMDHLSHICYVHECVVDRILLHA